MFIPGLTSNTFRKKTPAQVIQLAQDAGLKSIEWAGDVHVLPGDHKTAADVGRMTRDAGLKVAAYGSYYRCASPDRQPDDFDKVIEAAAGLQAQVIRVWAGNQSPEPDDQDYRSLVVDDLSAISAKAHAAGLIVALEFHRQTLTEDADSTLDLLQSTGAANLRTLWQPLVEAPCEASLASLQSLLPQIQHIHVFHRDINEASRRLPLAAGAAEWARYFSLAASAQRPMHTLIEFVVDDDTENFKHDAQTLLEILQNVCSQQPLNA